jgi:hypothetical protein
VLAYIPLQMFLAQYIVSKTVAAPKSYFIDTQLLTSSLLRSRCGGFPIQPR